MEKARLDFVKLQQAIRKDPRHQALLQNCVCNDVKDCRKALASCLDLCRHGRANPKSLRDKGCDAIAMSRLACMPLAIQRQIISMRYAEQIESTAPFVPGIYVRRCCGGYCLGVLVLYPEMDVAMWGSIGYSWKARYPHHFYSTWGQLVQHVQENPYTVPSPAVLADWALDPTEPERRKMPVLPIAGCNDLLLRYGGMVAREKYALVAPF